MENQFAFIPIIIVIFLIGFSALWLFIAFITSRLWGWHEMAQQYQGEMSYFNDRFTWRSGRFGWGSYSSVLTFSVNDEELGMTILFLYRVGHPPLKIPFDEITAVEKTVIFPEVHFSFERVPGRTLRISRRMAESIENASGGNFTFERKP